MIIQSLVRYYDYLIGEGVKIPRLGYSPAGVSFVLVISPDGKLTNLIDLRHDEKKKRSRQFEVPYQKDHTNKVEPHFICDNAKYVFGVEKVKEDTLKKLNAKPEDVKFLEKIPDAAIVVTSRSQKCFEEFRSFHHSLLDSADDSKIKIFLHFLDSWKPLEFLSNRKIAEYKDDIFSSGNFVFQVDGICLHKSPIVMKFWEAYYLAHIASGKTTDAQCLVTGQKGAVSRLHKKIRGVANSQSAGAPLVSFNNDAFCSYGQDQSFNAPVSEVAMFKYTTVLNYLLEYNSKNKIQIGDVTTVFWAETSAPYQDLTNILLNSIGKQQEKEKVETSEIVKVRDLSTQQLIGDILDKLRKGQKLQQIDIGTNPDKNFYILGLTSNNGRLAVRYWYQDSYGNFITNLARHHLDLEISRGKYGPDYISIPRLLSATLPRKRNKKLTQKSSKKETKIISDSKPAKFSPLISSLLINAILKNRPYPQQMFSAMINRAKTGSIEDYVQLDYVHTGFMKAYLIRLARAGLSNFKEEEITMSLNKASPSVPYHLGRLFAVLELAQRSAHNQPENPNAGIKRTIRDSYFPGASQTPTAVFPIILKLHQHHLSKLKSDKPGLGIYYSKLVAEILESVDKIPAYLSPEEQGMFMLGYYHQSIYRKGEENDRTEKEDDHE